MIISNKPITHIYHISDIHFRNLKRHKEYRHVLNQFIDNVKEDNIEDAIIYIGGDIAHAKTDMSPELIREISWFLVECANLKPTILIAGNHDCNLSNSYRLDVITPIVQNINHSNIHYLKDTGVYYFGNVAFAVYSILDKKENWPHASTINADTKICLFHGPINTARTDVGYSIYSKSFTSQLFDGFDMALLGDIHTRQFVDKPTIVYSGSAIQQNHSESLKGHGYLLWDVAKRTYQEFDIHNDYGFYTLDVIGGKVPIVTDIPKYPRLRVRLTNTEASKVKRVLADIRKKYKIEEFTVTRLDTLNNQKNGTFSNKISIGNVKDVEFQNQLLSEYLEHHFMLDDDTIERLKEINRNINLKIVDSDLVEGVRWIPKQFEFSNMFSYGEGNLIRFDNLNGLIGLFAPNAQGKSSVIDSLLFCMFDKTSRTILAKKIMNINKTSFECKFNFELDGVQYYIERKAKIVNRGKNVKVDVQFWKIEDGVVVSLNGKDRNGTNKVIREYLGTYEDFILTTISIQNNNALFIDKLQSDRKDILAQFLGVNIFDKLYQIASEDNKNNSILLKKFKQDDFTERLAALEIAIEKKNKELADTKSFIKEIKTKIETINDSIIQNNSNIISVMMDGTSIDVLNNRLNSEKSVNDKIVESLNSSYTNIEKLELLQIQTDDLMDVYDEVDILINYDILTTYRIRYDKLVHTLNQLQSNLSELENQLAHLNEHKYNENCAVCMDNSKLIILSKADLNSKIESTNSQILTLSDEIKILQTEINSVLRYEELYLKLEEFKSTETKINSELVKLINRVTSGEFDLLVSNERLKKINDDIENYYKNEKQILINESIRNIIAGLTLDKTKLNKQLVTAENMLLNIVSELSTLQSDIQSIENRILQIQGLEEENLLFEYYLNAVGRDGISYELISKILPAIEGEVNNILAQIVEFGVSIDIDGKNIDAYIVYDDKSWSLEMASGMERFITGIAIRVALINMCNLPKPNFLVIDEGMGTLDTDSLSSLYLLFSYLKTQFDFVLVISHLDTIRDMVDALAEIKKINGFSHIKI